MSGFRGTPVFQSAPLNAGSVYTSPSFTLAADLQLHLRDPRCLDGWLSDRAGGWAEYRERRVRRLCLQPSKRDRRDWRSGHLDE